MLKRMMCVFTSHAINRHRVWHDGIEFRTKCRRCGTPLHRTEEGWRILAADEQADSRRAAHPNSP